MPFAAALSTAGQTSQAIDDVCREAAAGLPDPADLALLFFSAHHADAADALVRAVRERLQPRCLLGCVGEAIIGNNREVEQRPAVSLWLGKWPGAVTLTPFHLTLEETPDGR